ncbi:MAG: ATP-dependent DNA helicase RecG, partial [Gammaproteobacteria bacterium]
ALTPIYPTADKLQQNRLRRLIDIALVLLADEQTDSLEILPRALLNTLNLPTLTDALDFVHRPPPDADLLAMAESRHPA